MATTLSRIRYLAWASARFLRASTTCPACNETETVLLRRKYIVTSLYRCPACELMFRVPKPSAAECDSFYQNEYKQGFATDCPAPDELRRLKETAFAGSERDYSGYIDVLRSTGLGEGSTILDFGSSWGYGSWQFARAGYKVYSSEISRPRARYSSENLGCNLCEPQNLPEKVDCFFSSHVIEHLTNPRQIWEIARSVLKPGGTAVLFFPNGDPSCELTNKNYHKYWGLVHPQLISRLAAKRMGELYGFATRCYTSPYNLEEISSKVEGTQSGGLEILVVATL